MPVSKRYLISSTTVLLLIGAAALLCIFGATVWLSQRTETDAAIVEKQRDFRSHALAIREGLLAAESSQRGYLLTGNEIYLAPYENAKLTARSEFEQLTADYAVAVRFKATMARLKALVTDRLNDLDEGIQLKNNIGAEETLRFVGSNEGKALMDETQVFLSAIVLDAEDALTSSLRTQTTNIAALRVGTMLASILIFLVVCGVVTTFWRYSQEIARARDALSTANTSLELRVSERTEDLARERDRAEILLTEVNHRVANNLAFVIALIKLQRQAVLETAAMEALDQTAARVQAIAEIHKHLYTSTDVTTVSLDQYLDSLLEQLERTLGEEGFGASIKRDIEPVQVATSASINLGIVVTEWVTNAFKYAYRGTSGEVRVTARGAEGKLIVAVQDDGVGIGGEKTARGTGVGSKIVGIIARSLEANVQYLDRSPGTEARLIMPMEAS